MFGSHIAYSSFVARWKEAKPSWTECPSSRGAMNNHCKRDGSELRCDKGFKIGDLIKIVSNDMEAGETNAKQCPSHCDSRGKESPVDPGKPGAGTVSALCPVGLDRR
jgi:hypothetical protein